ncbi:phosphotransferase family protein [Halobacterium yunchengense]|uniref:phosphotransferase family protein n=1 Tax=Halobacterium yunchengense TaxID=3108497 RepID=UPI00300B5126
MRRALDERLAAQFDSYRADRRLHDVPPHEVWAVVVDGERAVCKYDTGATGNAGLEGRVLAFVGDHTTVPVPRVLAVGGDYFVAAWQSDAPGADGDVRDPDAAWARAAGRGLATLHAETAAHLDGFGPLAFDGGTPTAPHDDWHAGAVANVRARRERLADFGHGDVADAVVDALRERPSVVGGAGDAVLCHGWWTPDHVAVRDGEAACVLDFEHAVAAPGEWDAWRTALPAFGGWETPAARAFRESYESVRSLPGGVAGRRSLYEALHGVYFLESLHVQDQHDAEATADRAALLRESVFDALDDLA